MYLLLFLGKNGYANAPQYYVIRTLVVLFSVKSGGTYRYIPVHTGKLNTGTLKFKSVNVVDEFSVRSAVSELLRHLNKDRPFRAVSYIVQRYIIFRALIYFQHFKYNFVRTSAYVFREMTIFYSKRNAIPRNVYIN